MLFKQIGRATPLIANKGMTPVSARWSTPFGTAVLIYVFPRGMLRPRTFNMRSRSFKLRHLRAPVVVRVVFGGGGLHRSSAGELHRNSDSSSACGFFYSDDNALKCNLHLVARLLRHERQCHFVAHFRSLLTIEERPQHAHVAQQAGTRFPAQFWENCSRPDRKLNSGVSTLLGERTAHYV